MTTTVNGTPATAWCPNCGDTHARADGKCARCGTGVVTATTQDALDAHTYRLGPKAPPAAVPAPVAAQAAKALELPGGAPTRRWYEQTKAMAESFGKAADEAEQRAHTASEDATRFRRAEAAFNSLLKQVNVAEPAAPVTTASSGQRWANGRVQADACIDCGRSDTRHIANGRCRTCDSRWRTAQKAAER